MFSKVKNVMSNIIFKTSRKREIRFQDYYVKTLPDSQNAIDIFSEEWSSRFPESANVSAGETTLFEDDRIYWAEDKLGGFKDKSVLELGPLEGAHTWMLEKMGASQISSIESNTRAYMKCLIVKEIMKIRHANFLCGDFVSYLKENSKTFDVCIASGVLYHMSNPVELLYLLGKAARQVFIWTHYFDESLISQNPEVRKKFGPATTISYSGAEYPVYKYEYEKALAWEGFCGGTTRFTHWLTREDIVNCLKAAGFKTFEIGQEQHYHRNGPSMSLVASQ